MSNEQSTPVFQWKLGRGEESTLVIYGEFKPKDIPFLLRVIETTRDALFRESDEVQQDRAETEKDEGDV